MSCSAESISTNEIIQIATDCLKDCIKSNRLHSFLYDCAYFEIEDLCYYNEHGESFSFLDFIHAYVPGSRNAINQSLVKILAHNQAYPPYGSRQLPFQEILIRLAVYGDYWSAQSLAKAVKPDELAERIHKEYNDTARRTICYDTDQTEDGYVMNRMVLFSHAVAYTKLYTAENINQLTNVLKEKGDIVDLGIFANALAAWCGMAFSNRPANEMSYTCNWHNWRPACLLAVLQIDEGVFIKVWDNLLKRRPRDWSSNAILPSGKEVLGYRDLLRKGDKTPCNIPYFISDWAKVSHWHFTNTGLSPKYKHGIRGL